MKRAKELSSLVWELLKGKKTYIAAIAALVYGFIQNEPQMLITGLGLLGLRHGLSTELARLIKK